MFLPTINLSGVVGKGGKRLTQAYRNPTNIACDRWVEANYPLFMVGLQAIEFRLQIQRNRDCRLSLLCLAMLTFVVDQDKGEAADFTKVIVQ